MKMRTWIIPVAGALAMNCISVSTQAAPIGGVTSPRLGIAANSGLEQAHYYRRHHYRYYRYYREPDFYFYRHHRRHHRYYRHW